MDSACVYEQQRVINELTQGIQMAKELRANLNSAEARKFFIQKILSSYHNALSALKSGDCSNTQPAWATTLPAQSLPDSSISNTSTESEFDQSFFNHQGQNVVSTKRKLGLTGWEDQVRMYTDNVLEMAYDGKRACNQGAGRGWAASPPQPPSPEKIEIKPTHNNHNQLYHEFSLPAPTEALSNLKANLSVDITSDFSTTIDVPSMFSIPPSTPSVGFSEEDFQQLHFPDYVDNELLQVYSPSFISPDTSESNYFSEWGSSQSLDFSSDYHHPAHVDDSADFLFSSSSFFLDNNNNDNDDPKFCRQLSLVDWDPTFLG